MRFFVTGTAGFIGFHLATRLLADGHSVVGFDGITPYYDVELKRRRHALLSRSPAFSAVEAMLEDAAALNDAAAQASPDVIVHLAAQAGVRYSLEKPHSYANSNLLGMVNMLEVCRALKPKHFIFSSTSSVYGMSDKPEFVETDTTDRPVSLYAASKKAGEVMAHSYAHLFDIPTTVCRFFTVYGPYGRPDMSLYKFVRAIVNDRPIDVFGNGIHQRDFTYVGDLVEAVSRIVHCATAGRQAGKRERCRGHAFRDRAVSRGQHRRRQDDRADAIHRDDRGNSRQEGHPEPAAHAAGRCRSHRRFAGSAQGADRIQPRYRHSRRAETIRRLVSEGCPAGVGQQVRAAGAMNLDDKKIAVIGLGYVGLPLAMEFARTRPVVGFDIRPERIAELRAGRDGTLEVDAADLARPEHIAFTDDAEVLARLRHLHRHRADADRQGQPPGPDAADPRQRDGRQGADARVASSSTNPPSIPAARAKICVPLLEKHSGLTLNEDFFVGYSPERANPGDRAHRLTTIVKVTSGSTPDAAEAIDGLYRSIVTAGTHRASSIEVAEAAKVIENTQRDLNIALMNELAIIFNRLGIDTLEVLAAAQTKWNFLPFRPGLVGGHCIGVDPYYLTHKAQEAGYHPEVILAGRRINDGMGRYVADQVARLMMKRGFPVVGSRILVMGLAFKENCPDIRNSKAIDIVRELMEFNATVEVWDPWVAGRNAKARGRPRLRIGAGRRRLRCGDRGGRPRTVRRNGRRGRACFRQAGVSPLRREGHLRQRRNRRTPLVLCRTARFALEGTEPDRKRPKRPSESCGQNLDVIDQAVPGRAATVLHAAIRQVEFDKMPLHDRRTAVGRSDDAGFVLQAYRLARNVDDHPRSLADDLAKVSQIVRVHSG